MTFKMNFVIIFRKIQVMKPATRASSHMSEIHVSTQKTICYQTIQQNNTNFKWFWVIADRQILLEDKVKGQKYRKLSSFGMIQTKEKSSFRNAPCW